MAASYPTSVKSFSTKSTTDTVEASHPNDLQDEVTAIETDLLAAFPGGGADGGQMKFPATQNPSTNANTLDDYEEGTFTPSLGGSVSQSGQVYTTQSGRYIKIGKQVLAWGRIVMSTRGTITGNVSVKALPFTHVSDSNARASASIGYWAGMTTNIIALTGVMESNASDLVLYHRASAGTGVAVLAEADLSNTFEVFFSVSYEATA